MTKRTDGREPGTTGLREVLIEELYALGLLDEIDEAIVAAGPSPAAIHQNETARHLARARLLWRRGRSEDRTLSREILAALSASDGDAAWRARLTLARIAASEDRLQEAAGLLHQAVVDFRGRTKDGSDSSSDLSTLLSREVARLQSSAHAQPGHVDVPRTSHRPGSSKPEGVGEAPAAGKTPSSPASGLDPRTLLRLVELGKRLAAEGDPDEVLRMVLHEAIGLSGAERGFLVLVRGEDFEFALAENIDRSEVMDPTFEVSRSLIRRVVAELRPILLVLPEDDPSGDPAAKSLADIGARSVACLPIVHGGAALGVLYLDGRNPAHTFQGPMERCLDLFASQAAVALENARSHRAKSRALEAAEETIRRHRTESERRMRYEGMIGASDAMQEVYRKLDLIAPSGMPVIILGETGTGKELVARLLHTRGPRARREFVAMNCAGMPDTLLEAELFGHERGAYTGADRARAGLFEIAHGGTLFLDEVGDMSPRMQADLLRTLQSGEVRRVGGHETIHVDVRIIAATHRNLEELVRRGEFRQDLYFRLNVLGLRLPSLRERAEDIPLLVKELMAQVAPTEETRPTVSERAMRRLVAYRWPGNVRELLNVLRRLSVLGAEVIDEGDLPAEILGSTQRSDRPGTLRKAEDDAVRRAFEASGGNKTEAARILGVDRKTLYTKLRRIGLDVR